MTEEERSKVMTEAALEAQTAWGYSIDGFQEKMREHRTAFRALMRLAVNLGIATEDDEKTIWEKSHKDEMELHEWKKMERERLKKTFEAVTNMKAWWKS